MNAGGRRGSRHERPAGVFRKTGMAAIPEQLDRYITLVID